jgi:ferric-dicitrate binding protein FerR (iron transport regulator)
MKPDVTRQVVSDLWALCRTGDASADSRALVDAFLAQDPAFAESLKESEMMNTIVPHVQLSPDAERRMLDDAARTARLKLLVIGGSVALVAALLFAAFAGVLLVVFRHGA